MSERESTSEAEQLVGRWFDELFNEGDLGVADEILADDVDYHGPTSLTPDDVGGPDDIKEYVELYQNAFPDLWYTVERRYPTGDGLAVQWTVTGTHESDLLGIEATGEMFEVEGINLFDVEDGAIAAVRSEWDTLKMAQELDVVPPVGPSGD